MIFMNALKETLNPKGGHGVGETVIVLAVIIAITILTLYNKEIPPALMILISAIGGVISGYKVGQNAKKEGAENGENDV